MFEFVGVIAYIVGYDTCFWPDFHVQEVGLVMELPARRPPSQWLQFKEMFKHLYVRNNWIFLMENF